jgi:predicted RNase H-like HicB family nuclease
MLVGIEQKYFLIFGNKMKYKIVVDKENEGLYFAYCQVIPHIWATGDTMGIALSSLMQKILCHLQDPDAEFEIIAAGNGVNGTPQGAQAEYISLNDEMVRK